jgi:hypothetical protein
MTKRKTMPAAVAAVLISASAVAPALGQAQGQVQGQLQGQVLGQTPSKAPVEVPLSLREGHMVVPVSAPDGTRLNFLVSTGTAVTVLSESAATRIGVGAPTLGGVTLDMEGHQTLPDARLTFGAFKADGMVGNNTLNQFDNLFDVPGGRLVLKPFGRAVEWPGMTLSDPIRLRILHGVVPTLDVEVNGTTFAAFLELGAQKLLVNQAVLDQARVAGGTAALALGASAFHDVPIELSDNPIIARFTAPENGFVIVGAPLVWHCAVSVSWVHQELRTCVP